MLLRPLHEFLRLHLPLSPRRWRVTSERERRLVQCNFSSSFGCALHPEPFSLLRNKTRPYHSGSSFSPLLWAGGLGEGKDAGCLGEGNDAEQPRIGVGLGGALLPPHGRRRERSLDNGILVNQIMGLSRWGYPTTTGRILPLCSGISGIGCDILPVGALAQGESTVSRVAPCIAWAKGGCAWASPRQPPGRKKEFRNLLTSPPQSNSANSPGSQTIPNY